MKKIIYSLIFINFLLNSCDYLNFAYKVQQDAVRNMNGHKIFFKSLFFSGDIREKKYCEHCKINKYQLIVNIKEKEPKNINIGNISYQPFYVFNDSNQLIISVTRKIYESVKVGSFIIKEKNSDYLFLGKMKFNLISDKNSQWLPD